jgi:hypothetical protein
MIQFPEPGWERNFPLAHEVQLVAATLQVEQKETVKSQIEQLKPLAKVPAMH